MNENAGLNRLFDTNQECYKEAWATLLRFPSISADPAHDKDCEACAAWLVSHLRDMGLAAELLPTPSKPVVFAERAGDSDKPTVLFYGHYDVQPVDPLESWDTPPFDPQWRDGRLYARGAEDNKGQLFYALKAMEALIQQDQLRCTLKIILEGEEECGSKGISSELEKWAQRLSADVLMVTDTCTVASGAPTIIMGLRGIIHCSLSLAGPDRDLHSGVHGGVAPNPATELAKLLASLHACDGSIAVTHFCDALEEPTEQERKLSAADPFDAAVYERETGVPPAGGEKRFTPRERAGFRPSLDVNGMHSGYTGAGVKTIIPATAQAKLTARLVAGQDPETALESIIAHLMDRVPDGLVLTITEQGVGGPGFRLDPNSPLILKAQAVLDSLSEKETVFLWEGASIPVVSGLSRATGAEPLLVGFGCEADNIHAPNESFSLAQFKSGFLYVARMLLALGA